MEKKEKSILIGIGLFVLGALVSLFLVARFGVPVQLAGMSSSASMLQGSSSKVEQRLGRCWDWYLQCLRTNAEYPDACYRQYQMCATVYSPQ